MQLGVGKLYQGRKWCEKLRGCEIEEKEEEMVYKGATYVLFGGTGRVRELESDSPGSANVTVAARCWAKTLRMALARFGNRGLARASAENDERRAVSHLREFAQGRPV